MGATMRSPLGPSTVAGPGVGSADDGGIGFGSDTGADTGSGSGSGSSDGAATSVGGKGGGATPGCAVAVIAEPAIALNNAADRTRPNMP